MAHATNGRKSARYADQMNREAGWAFRYSAPRQKHLAKRRLLLCLSQETLIQAEEDVAEYELAVALTADDKTLRARLEAHDAALRNEIGSEVNALIYNRALRVLRGWRVAP